MFGFVVVGKIKGGGRRWEKRERSMNAKTAADKKGSLGAGSEKQTRHQATGSVSVATKDRGAGLS